MISNKKQKPIFRTVLLLTLCLIPFSVSPVSIGSTAAVSRQSNAFFPSADSDNTMLGFAVFENGFSLEDIKTTCTYSAYFPVSGNVILAGGYLWLNEDLTLANNCNVVSPGNILGNNKALRLMSTSSRIKIPSLCVNSFGGLLNLSEQSIFSTALSMDWAPNGSYLVVGAANTANANPEIFVYSFNGSVLSLTQSIDTGGYSVNGVRFHPTLNYVALCEASTPSYDIFVYSLNPSTGQLTETGEAYAGADGLDVCWHSSGKYLLTATNSTYKELILCDFNTITGVLTEAQLFDITPDRAANSLSFCPGGNYLAVGTAYSASASELLIYPFNGTIVNSPVSANIDYTVKTLDWSPTGTYIAVGLASGSGQSLRIYSHDSAGGTVTECTNARVGETLTIRSVHWDNTGDYLAVGVAGGTTSEFRIYYFDKTNLTLTLVCSRNFTSDENAVRWSRDVKYIAHNCENPAYKVSVDLIMPPVLTFHNTTIVCNSDLEFCIPVQFKGVCKIVGRNNMGMNPRLQLHSGTVLEIRPGGSLIFDGLEVDGVAANNIRCTTDNGSITLRNCNLNLSSDYTYSRGSMLWIGDVSFTGTNKFNYTTALTSTINSDATLLFDSVTTFSYNPRVAKRNLIYMPDVTSKLFLNGCTLYSTRTGLQLTQGCLLIDQKTTFTSEARYNAEAISLSSNLAVKLLGNATLEVFGRVTYD